MNHIVHVNVVICEDCLVCVSEPLDHVVSSSWAYAGGGECLETMILQLVPYSMTKSLTHKKQNTLTPKLPVGNTL